MICNECGKENPEGHLFCSQCGSRIERRNRQQRQGERRVADRRRNAGGEAERAPRTWSGTGTTAGGGALSRPPAASPRLEPENFSERRESPAREPRSAPDRAGPSFGSSSSFLGLEESPSYLLEEEQPSGGRSYGRFIAILILLAAVAAVAVNWERIKEAATAARDHSVIGGSSATASAPSAESLPVTSAPVAAPPGDEVLPPKNATPGDAASQAADPPGSQSGGQDANDDTNAERPKTKASAADVQERARNASEKRPERSAPAASPAGAVVQGGESRAAVNQADQFLYGESQNCGRALSILDRAARQGNFEAQTKLGVLYATGTCVPFDRVRAYHWYTVASRSSDSPWIEKNKSMLWSQMSNAEKQQVAGR